MRYLNVQATLNEAGLTRSAQLVAQALRAAGTCVTINTRHRSLMAHGRHKTAKLIRSHPFDVNIFLEDIDPACLPLAPIHVLIPNQEWFQDRARPHLGAIDAVLCKTRHAEEIFRPLVKRVEYSSFTSVDRRNARVRTDYGSFVHVAGRSKQKGTDAVFTTWARHPEWPTLTVIQHPLHRREVTAPNIRYLAGRLDDDALRSVQNRSGVHVCPSEAEGFGHTLVEAMSCGAVVVTTDGPPMNELLTPDRGVLVPYRRTARQRLGTNYYVDVDALEQAIARVIALSDTEKRALGASARRWYEVNDRFFRRRIVELVADIQSLGGRDR